MWTLGISNKYVSEYWEQHLGIWMNLESEEDYRRRRTVSSTRICLFSLLGMGVDGEERSLQEVCFSASNEAEGLDLEEREQQKRRRPSVNLPASLGSVLYVSRGWSRRAGIKQLRRRRSGGCTGDVGWSRKEGRL